MEAYHTYNIIIGYVYSAIGSLVYSYIKYAEQQEKKQQDKKLKYNGEVTGGSNTVVNIEHGLSNQDNGDPPIPPHLK